MKSERKKYNYMEPVLHKIHKNYVTLKNKDVKRNNGVLKQLLQKLIKRMKQVDNLFNKLFTEVFYGGSFYDGLKVGKPDEFDLHFLLNLPKNAKPSLDISNIPGFVQVQLKNFEHFQKTPEAKDWSGLASLLDTKHYLVTDKVSSWIQGIIYKAMEKVWDCESNGNGKIFKANGVFKGTIEKTGPAHTMKLTMCGTIKKNPIKIDIDLVPGFQFGADQWPSSPFLPNPTENKPNFFIVPKEPYRDQDVVERYWRLSFQMQERELIKNKLTLKPTLRLIKKLQKNNKDEDIVASYYIKNIFLCENHKSNDDLWKSSQSFAFVTMLKKYKEYIENRNIPYYWNERDDLLENKGDKPLQNLANALQHFINAIESHPGDAFIVAEYLLNKEELASFRANNGYKK